MLVFVDESGYPIPSDASEKSVLLAVCIRELDLRTTTQKLFVLKDTIFGKQDEIKSTQLFHPKVITRKWDKNIAYADGIMQILLSVDSGVFAIVMDRPSFVPYTPEGMLPVQYHRLLQRIQTHCNINQSSLAMCIFDQTNDGRDKKYAMGFNNFLYRSKEGKSFDKVLVSPLFVSSAATSAMELADVCAGLVRNCYTLGLHERLPITDYEKWLFGLYTRMTYKTHHYPYRGGMLYGIYQMPCRCFRKANNDCDAIEEGICEISP